MNPAAVPGRDLLVVDADESVRLDVETVLRAEGFTVRVATGLDECWPLLAARLPDMVLLDIQTLTAAGEGVDIYEELKSRYPDLPVVVTAHNA